MIKDIFNSYSLYIIFVLCLIIAVIVIALVTKKKKDKILDETNSSILDVNVDGVVDKDFEYGYEKEDTVVIKTKKTNKKKK